MPVQAVSTILHLVPSLDPAHGGPSRTVVGLTDALGRQGGLPVALLSQGYADGPQVPSEVAAVHRQVAVSRSRLALAMGLPLRRALASYGGGSPPGLVHSHGIWHPGNHWAARAARIWGVPLVVQPRGMLEPWALGHRAWKKRLALTLFQWRDLVSARAFVATSEAEYFNVRRLGLRQPVAVIPNGVALPGDAAVQGGMPALSARVRGTAGDSSVYGQRAGRDRERMVLFLSRIHPKKGVLELVRAWGDIAPIGWRLCIAGPDVGGHWAEVARLVDHLGLGATMDYLGPVEGERKAALYRQADLFVLPTYSENFGLVVAEALSYGLPVITTRGAPWADLETYDCGWWIDTGAAPLVAALRAAMALSDEVRQAMGVRGRRYVKKYDWATIAAETLALYHWLLGQGGRPSCVRCD